jgi:hypothetical protein
VRKCASATGDCATRQRVAVNRMLNALAQGVRAFQPDNVAGLLLASREEMLRRQRPFVSAGGCVDHDEAISRLRSAFWSASGFVRAISLSTAKSSRSWSV